jgi:uncharacterized protein YjiS (DUF1127 family)
MFDRLLERRRRYQAYQQMRKDLEALPEEDLIDMGVKRYQLGTIARIKALG